MPPSNSPDIAAAPTSAATPAPRWFRIVGAISVPWNLVGLGTFLADVGVFGAGAVAPGVAAMPMPVFVAYGITCVTGVVGSVGLFLLRRWARALLWISAIAAVIDWGWVLGYVSGASVPLGVTVLLGAALLVVLSEMAARRGWLT